MLKISNLGKKYGNTAVIDDISFQVPQGKTLVITGDNGAGKSTLLKIMATLLSPDQGEIKYKSQDILKEPQIIRAEMGYVPQEIALHRQLSLEDNLDFWADINGLKKTEKKAALAQLIAIFGLEPYLKTIVAKLSGGLQRRLNIAVSFIKKPEIFFMDEPTVNIDAASKKEILEIILKLKQEGVTIIYVTHLIDEVRLIADDILHLEQGKIKFNGPAAEFFTL